MQADTYLALIRELRTVIGTKQPSEAEEAEIRQQFNSSSEKSQARAIQSVRDSLAIQRTS